MTERLQIVRSGAKNQLFLTTVAEFAGTDFVEQMDNGVTTSSGTALKAENAAWADWNGDTYLDLIVVQSGVNVNLLYKNDGKGGLDLITESMGGLTIDSDNSMAACWGDWNKVSSTDW